jgi:hypothetical protein
MAKGRTTPPQDKSWDTPQQDPTYDHSHYPDGRLPEVTRTVLDKLSRQDLQTPEDIELLARELERAEDKIHWALSRDDFRDRITSATGTISIAFLKLPAHAVIGAKKRIDGSRGGRAKAEKKADVLNQRDKSIIEYAKLCRVEGYDVKTTVACLRANKKNLVGKLKDRRLRAILSSIFSARARKTTA